MKRANRNLISAGTFVLVMTFGLFESSARDLPRGEQSTQVKKDVQDTFVLDIKTRLSDVTTKLHEARDTMKNKKGELVTEYRQALDNLESEQKSLSERLEKASDKSGQMRMEVKTQLKNSAAELQKRASKLRDDVRSSFKEETPKRAERRK